MSTFNVAGLSAPFTKDPSIALMEYLRDNYSISKPAKGDVGFDTKFARLDKDNYVIIEKISKTAKSETLGMARVKYDDVKRIQIFCHADSAKNDRFLIEEHIDELINANPTALQSDGIREMMAETFQDIQYQGKPEEPNKPAIEATNISRSFCMVRLKYTKVRV